MKKLNLILLAILGVAIVLFYMSQDPYREPTRSYIVEGVEIDKYNDHGWAVKGMVRNFSKSDVRGYVTIKFLNSNGDITYSTRTRVNDGDYFGYTQAAPFEYFKSPEYFEGVTDFDVEFIKN